MKNSPPLKNRGRPHQCELNLKLIVIINGLHYKKHASNNNLEKHLFKIISLICPGLLPSNVTKNKHAFNIWIYKFQNRYWY